MVRFASSFVALRHRVLDLAAGFALGAAVSAAAFAALSPGRPSVPSEAPAASVAGGRAVSASALSVIDGDTFEARVAAFPGQEIVARVRIAGLDAPERQGRCPSETEAANRATRALAGLVEGRRLTLTDLRGDKYFGRVVARVESAGAGDVAAAMIGAGHGRAYGGGKRAGWC